MNLEHVEQRCLNYLKQSRNPLVPLEQLLKHCQEDESCAGINQKILIEFLRHHHEVRVLEGPTEDAPVDPDTFAAAGLLMGTRIIYRERMPTQLELVALIKEHLAGMVATLEAAINKENGELGSERKAELESALVRARALQEKARELR